MQSLEHVFDMHRQTNLEKFSFITGQITRLENPPHPYADTQAEWDAVS